MCPAVVIVVLPPTLHYFIADGLAGGKNIVKDLYLLLLMAISVERIPVVVDPILLPPVLPTAVAVVPVCLLLVWHLVRW